MEKKELRCRSCRSLLATEDGRGLTIQRSRMRATVRSASEAEFECYRCGSSTLFKLRRGPLGIVDVDET